MALTIQDLYQNVLGRAPDTGGLSFWQDYAATRGGPGIDPEEIAAFVAAAQAEKPGSTYAPPRTPTLVVPDNYPVYGPSGPVQTPIKTPTTPPPAPTPTPALDLIPLPRSIPSTLTVEQLYENVLGRAADPTGLKFWQDYVTSRGGPGIDPDELAAFIKAAREEKPAAGYDPNYVYKTTTTTPTTTPAPSPAPGSTPAVGLSQLFARPKYKETTFRSNAPTLEQLYQNVLGRAPDTRGLEFWRDYVGSSIDPDEIAAFVAAAQTERPGAFYAGSNAPPRPLSYADTALLAGSSGALPGIPSVIGRTYLPGGEYLNPTGVSTLVAAPSVFSGVPTDPRTGKPMTETARPAVNAPPPKAVEGKKAGGLASLANELESKGRNGDTELVHMTKDEVAGLHSLARSMGGQLTRNPYTGLYEASWLSKRWKEVTGGVEKVADAVGIGGLYRDIKGGIKKIGDNPYVQGIITAIAGATYGPLGSGAVRTAFALNDGQSTEKALRSGAKAAATTYALQELSGVGAPGSQPPAPVEIRDLANIPTPGPSAMIPTDPSVISYTPDPNSFMGGASPISQTAMLDQPVMTDAVGSSGSSIANQINAADKAYEATRPFMDRAGDYLSNLGTKALDYAVENPFKTAAYGTVALSGIQGMRESEKLKEENERRLAEQEEKRRRYRATAEEIMSRYPIRFAARGGMLDDIDDPRDEVGYGMAGGGMPPRFLSGGGDGMSDSIPAVIGGKQPARLADGEFVIPADVVSHLGNGSSKAGAKQLYSMMNRIRKARTGTTKQGKEVNPRRFMPA